MIISNCIAACGDGRARSIGLHRRTRLIIHRCEVGQTAAEISKAFTTDPELKPYTGSEMPYTFVIRRDGTIEQALPLSEYGPHARRWSIEGIGVACVGDFRKERPTPQQWDSLVELCVAFIPWLGDGSIFGHTELRDASHDPNKVCPGKLLDLNALREYTSAKAKTIARQSLVSSGVTV